MTYIRKALYLCKSEEDRIDFSGAFLRSRQIVRASRRKKKRSPVALQMRSVRWRSRYFLDLCPFYFFIFFLCSYVCFVFSFVLTRCRLNFSSQRNFSFNPRERVVNCKVLIEGRCRKSIFGTVQYCSISREVTFRVRFDLVFSFKYDCYIFKMIFLDSNWKIVFDSIYIFM